MTWDRVERLIGAENLKRLAAAKVGVIGLGSGGGFVAEALAMSGVGKFVLVDDDVLEAPNIPRHVANRQYLGKPKAEALAELIRLRNPDAEIAVQVGRIEAHMDVLDGLDLLIVAVDVEQVKYIINQACLQRNLAAVYAGVYERGEGGDVAIIRPGDGPCYACWAAELREGIGQDNSGEALDYGMIGPEGTLEAEPGLWLHVVRVAGVQADFALRHLLNGADSGLPTNTVVLANNAIEIITGQITPPHSAVWVQIDRDPQCLVCGDRIRAHETGEREAGVTQSLDDLAGEMGIDVQEEADDQESQARRQQSSRR